MDRLSAWTRKRFLATLLTAVMLLNLSGIAMGTFYPICVSNGWHPCGTQMSINESGIREIGKSTTGGAIAGGGAVVAASFAGPLAPIVAAGMVGLGTVGGFLTGVTNSLWDGNLRFGW